MAFVKIVCAGDDLIFDLTKKIEKADRITISLIKKVGKVAILEISADRSILISQFRVVNGQTVQVSPKPYQA